MKTWFRMLLLVICFGLASCDRFIDYTIRKRIETQQEQANGFKDGNLHVVLVGSGGPLSNTDRVASGIAVLAGEEFILVDAGPGIVRNLNLQGLPVGDLKAVFLTHFHSDHITDLGELTFMSWAQGNGRSEKLAVYGPEGVEQVVRGFNMAYALDSGYRVAHHGEAVMSPQAAGMRATTLSIPDPDAAVPFFNRNGLKASVFLVDHFPVVPAVGYRFEYKGNVVVITGDTKKTETLVEHSRGADILFAEALDVKLVDAISRIALETNLPRLSKQMKDVQDYHMTPVQAAEIARDAGVGKLVFIHVTPPLVSFIAERLYLDGVSDVFDGDIIIGEDGMQFNF